MPGFAELAGIYSRFRTLSMSYQVDYANQEAFPITAICGFSSSGALTPTIAYAGNPLWKSRVIGAAGGSSTCRLTGSATIAQIAGTKQALFDDIYTGSTTSSTLVTAGKEWLYAAINSTTLLTALGCVVSSRVKLRIQFYKQNTLAV